LAHSLGLLCLSLFTRDRVHHPIGGFKLFYRFLADKSDRVYIGGGNMDGSTFLGYYKPTSGTVRGSFLTQPRWIDSMAYDNVDKNVYVSGYGFLGKLDTITNQYQSYQFRKYALAPSQLLFDPVTNNLIVMLDAALFHLKPSATTSVMSTSINNISFPIKSATLTANDELFNGIIKYYLSNDGGVNWYNIQNGNLFYFPKSGSDLRWKVILSNDPPVVHFLRIDYTYGLPTL
ncbi:MAG: hypothetical protein ACP5PT_06420, partial [Brevinematia bacterium]